MPALIDIRRRIRSVKSTEQITKAMKMVSASKLRRAQEAMFAARPYARKMVEVLGNMASRATPTAHPLLREGTGSRTALIVVTADKGLCGGFNANIIRAAMQFLGGKAAEDVELFVVGRKARDFFRRRPYKIRDEHVGVFQPLRYQTAQEIARRAMAAFTSGEVDHVHLVYNEFKSVIQQRIVTDPLLPVPRSIANPKEPPPLDYLYEPDPAQIFRDVLPKYVEIRIWHAMLESAAAEHGARMTAMDAATKNASEAIDRLTLYMNKVRQAAITKEIIEVVSGAGSTA
jgi:F-type H+-transporting ATPase subunit gamma